MAEEGGFPAHPPSIFKMAFSSEGKSALKERFRKGKITDYSLDLFSPHNGKSPAERLRDLDYIRMHTPYEDEVAILNVTPYRMDILSSQEVMYLCGGLVGVRFSSEDLMTILKTTKKMTSVWEELSVLFNNMPTGTKKAVLRDDAEDSETTRALRAFHERADEYVAQFGELQSLIREKQKLIDPSLRLGTYGHRCFTVPGWPHSLRSFEIIADMPKLDADPESRMGRKLPDWLSTLIEKHQRSKAGGEGAAAVRSSQLRVGELSVYLSSCIAGLVQTNEAETEAIAIVSRSPLVTV